MTTLGLPVGPQRYLSITSSEKLSELELFTDIVSPIAIGDTLGIKMPSEIQAQTCD